MKVFKAIEMRPGPSRTWIRISIAAVLISASIILLVDVARMRALRVEQLEQERVRSSQERAATDRLARALAERERVLRQLDEQARPWLTAVEFPWDELLLSVERLSAPGARAISLSVDAETGVARLAIECRDAAQAMELVQTLDEGRVAGQRRWKLLSTRTVTTSSNLTEAELQFNSVSQVVVICPPKVGQPGCTLR